MQNGICEYAPTEFESGHFGMPGVHFTKRTVFRLHTQVYVDHCLQHSKFRIYDHVLKFHACENHLCGWNCATNPAYELGCIQLGQQTQCDQQTLTRMHAHDRVRDLKLNPQASQSCPGLRHRDIAVTARVFEALRSVDTVALL